MISIDIIFRKMYQSLVFVCYTFSLNTLPMFQNARMSPTSISNNLKNYLFRCRHLVWSRMIIQDMYSTWYKADKTIFTFDIALGCLFSGAFSYVMWVISRQGYRRLSQKRCQHNACSYLAWISREENAKYVRCHCKVLGCSLWIWPVYIQVINAKNNQKISHYSFSSRV